MLNILSHLRPFSATLLLRMRRNRYLWTCSKISDAVIRFLAPDFFRVRTFGDLATISVDFSILYAECPPYFYFWFVWPTDLESIPDASTQTAIIPTRCDADMTIHCRVFVCWYVMWPCDLDLWPFDVEQLTYMAGHVTNLATKFENPTPIRSWVMTYKVSRWLPLKMRTRQLRMRRITWPLSRGQKQLHFWNVRPRIAYYDATSVSLRWKQLKLSTKIIHGPVLKDVHCMSFCACAKSRDLLKVP